MPYTSNGMFVINTDEVSSVGDEIDGDAQNMIDGVPLSRGKPTTATNLQSFQSTMTAICHYNFPKDMQPALEVFIKAHHDGYLTAVLQDRQLIASILQGAALSAAGNDELNADLFEPQS